MAGPVNRKPNTTNSEAGAPIFLTRNLQRKTAKANTITNPNESLAMKSDAVNTTIKKSLRLCSNGHRYYKSSDCPVCPICEEERKPKDHFLSSLSAPARRALESENITSLEKLATKSEKYILSLHGIGPASIPVLRTVLTEAGLSFSKK